MLYPGFDTGMMSGFFAEYIPAIAYRLEFSAAIFSNQSFTITLTLLVIHNFTYSLSLHC